MISDLIRIFPLGDTALTVEFGNCISEEINRKAIGLASFIESSPFNGFVEAVPAYSSTTIFYDLNRVRKHHPGFRTAYDAVKSYAEAAVADLNTFSDRQSLTVEIPFRYDTDAAPDLDHIAGRNGLSPEEAIEIFTSITYRVYMLGFLPGFTYMGEVDDRISTPRKESPRLIVPKGSIGIAGKQTGVYSLESPGGWQIIGRTNVELFTPNDKMPCLLQPGDTVRFITAK